MDANGAMMTMAEMEAAYPGEWVLIADPELSPEWEIVGGRVLLHDSDPDRVEGRAPEFSLKRSAVIFLGDPPADLGYLF